MAYLNSWQDSVPQLIQGNDTQLPPSIANTWPAFEVMSPQYPMPSVWNMVTHGYRADSLVFACMDVRAQAISEPPMKVYRGRKKDKEEVEDHPARSLLERPNSEMGEAEFWRGVQIYMDVAGFSPWEVELSNGGKPIALWPLNPVYCSFMRGPHQPIRAVRYLVPGLPPVDIPRERLILFQEFDPLYPWIRSLSRTAVALKEIGVRLSITDFLKVFFEHGTAVNGLLSTTQSLTDAEAKRNRDRWIKHHGGHGNWGQPAVLGNGLTYQNVQTSFKEMAFPEIDGRVEASICMAYRVSPIIVNAKIGLGVSSYNNRAQADDAFTEEVRKPSWRYYSSETSQQLLPFYGSAASGLYCQHDTSDVSALKEDETAIANMVERLAARNVMYRDEARRRLNLEPVDNGEKIFLGATVKAVEAPAITSAIMDPETDVESLRQAEQQAQEQALAPGSTTPPPASSALTGAPSAQAQVGQTAAPAKAPVAPAEQFNNLVATAKALGEWRRDMLEYVEHGLDSMPPAPKDIPPAIVTAILGEAKSVSTTTAMRKVFARNWPKGAGAPNVKASQDQVIALLERATLAAEKLSSD